VLASFGSSQGLNKPVFSVELKADPNAAPIVYEKPLRYGKREHIHHTFRSDPKNPPKIISAFFVLAVLATVPALFIGVCTNYLLSSRKPLFSRHAFHIDI
jgi:oligosaccharyltransferase complex subunit delta (ribophorin II)